MTVWRGVAALAALAAALGLAATEAGAKTERTAYVNGRIWTGDRFTPGALVVEDHRFVDAPAETASVQIDLAGGFVTPPLCDAHSHEIQSDWMLEETLAQFRDQGVAYMKILSSVPEYTHGIDDRLNAADGVEASFAGPPITGPGGHPLGLQLRFLEYGAYPDKSAEDLAGFSYIPLNTVEDLDAAWPDLLDRGVDFIKIMILDAARHAERMGVPDWLGRTGLAPDLVAAVVSRAHADGLTVSAHVNTIEDLRLAVAAGVDEIAHLPGRMAPQRVTRADARAMAEAGTRLVTTAALADRLAERAPALYAQVRQAQTESLANLKAEGVRLALGTDGHVSVIDEVLYLHALGVFTSAELIDMATSACAKAVFPDRKIGQLHPGYEAAFVVFEADPLVDLANAKKVTRRVKPPRSAAYDKPQ